MITHIQRHERRLQIVERVRSGEPLKDVAAAYGLGVYYIHTLCLKAGVPLWKESKTEGDYRMSFAQKRKRRRAAMAALRRGKPIADVATEHQIGVSYLYMLCRQADPPVHLSKADLRSIYSLQKLGESTRQRFLHADWTQKDVTLAKEFNLSRERIRQIRKGMGKPPSRAYYPRLSPEELRTRREQAKEALLGGKSIESIAEATGFSAVFISEMNSRLKAAARASEKREKRLANVVDALRQGASPVDVAAKYELSYGYVLRIRQAANLPLGRREPRTKFISKDQRYMDVVDAGRRGIPITEIVTKYGLGRVHIYHIWRDAKILAHRTRQLRKALLAKRALRKKWALRKKRALQA